MTVQESTICSLIQTFPVLLILAQNHNRCLKTPLIYKPPTPTQSPEYYEALDALFHNLFGHGYHDSHGYGGHGCTEHGTPGYSYGYPYGHGHHSHGYGSHGYGSHGYGIHGYGNHAHGHGYPIYGYKKVNVYNTSGHGYKGNYAPTQIYNMNHKYKVVVRRHKVPLKRRSQKLRGFLANQRDERRFGNPLNFAQNFIPESNRIRNRLEALIHVRPPSQDSNQDYIYPFNNRRGITNNRYYDRYGRPNYPNQNYPEYYPYYEDEFQGVRFPNNPNFNQYPNQGSPDYFDQGNYEEMRPVFRPEVPPHQIQPSEQRDEANHVKFPNSNNEGNQRPETPNNPIYPTNPQPLPPIISVDPIEPSTLPPLTPVPPSDAKTENSPFKPIPPLNPTPDFPPLNPTPGFPPLNPVTEGSMVFPPFSSSSEPTKTTTEASPFKEPSGTKGIPTLHPAPESESKNFPPLTPVPASENPAVETTEDKDIPQPGALPELTPVPPSDPNRSNFDSRGVFKETCETVDNEIGSCVSVFDCQHYLSLLQQSKSNPAVVQILRKAHCGFEGDNPKVCCPRPGIPAEIPTAPPTPAPTPAPTPTPTEPPVAPKTAGDYVAAFPEPPECGVSNASLSRVVGGVDAKLGDFPWLAVLGYKNSRGTLWQCGGSLITSRHVLTAAHCIYLHEKSLYVVRVGELDLMKEDDGATPVDVLIKTMIMHEEYNRQSFVNDIGVLVLQRDVPFTDLIRPICLPRDTELRARSFENYNPLIAGWGNTRFRGPAASHLQVLQLPVVGNDYCKQAYSNYTAQIIDQRVLCAGYKKGGKDACQGDSGGPLMMPVWNSKTYVTYFYQIGVVSYGKNCAEAGFPGVYTRVTEFIPWLEKTVLGNS